MSKLQLPFSNDAAVASMSTRDMPSLSEGRTKMSNNCITSLTSNLGPRKETFRSIPDSIVSSFKSFNSSPSPMIKRRTSGNSFARSFIAFI